MNGGGTSARYPRWARWVVLASLLWLFVVLPVGVCALGCVIV